MTSFRIIHISDTHLSRERPWLLPNFEAMARIIAAEKPDLVVNTGDMAFHESDADLAFAKGLHAALPVPLRCIPGNHDLGDNPWRGPGDYAISAERLARYRRHFGADWWRMEAGDWQLIGLN